MVWHIFRLNHCAYSYKRCAKHILSQTSKFLLQISRMAAHIYFVLFHQLGIRQMGWKRKQQKYWQLCSLTKYNLDIINVSNVLFFCYPIYMFQKHTYFRHSCNKKTINFIRLNWIVRLRNLKTVKIIYIMTIICYFLILVMSLKPDGFNYIRKKYRFFWSRNCWKVNNIFSNDKWQIDARTFTCR